MTWSEAAVGITRPAVVCVVMSDVRFEIAYFPCSMEGARSWADCNQADWWPRPAPPAGVVAGLMVLCSALQTFFPHHVPLEVPSTQQRFPHPIIPSPGLRPGPQPGPTARRSHPGKRLGRGPGTPGQPPQSPRQTFQPQNPIPPPGNSPPPGSDKTSGSSLPLSHTLRPPAYQQNISLPPPTKHCIPLCWCDGFVSKRESWRVVEVSVYQNRS